MIATLTACREAINGGVEEVLMVDGRHGAVLARALEGSQADLPATRMVDARAARTGTQRATRKGVRAKKKRRENRGTTTASAFDAGQIRQSEAAHVLPIYRRAPIVLV